MKLEKNVISFEVDEKTIKAFELATSILEKDPDQAFKEWIQRLSYLAMRSSIGENSEGRDIMLMPFRSPERMMMLKIARWVAQPKTMAFNMIKSFFLIYNKNEKHEVNRDEMLRAYLSLDFENERRKNEDSFIRNFRMMCSSSAYGDIFSFDSATQIVTLNSKIAPDILKYKDAFIA